MFPEVFSRLFVPKLQKGFKKYFWWNLLLVKMLQSASEAYLAPSQTSMMKLFAKLVDG